MDEDNLSSKLMLKNLVGGGPAFKGFEHKSAKSLSEKQTLL